MVKEIVHQYEVNSLACGQAVLSMLTGADINEIFLICGTKKEISLKQLKDALSYYGILYESERKQVFDISDLPEIAVLSLETPRCWHWSLYFKGKVYDPEHGVLDDFPISNRKYYWKINEV